MDLQQYRAAPGRNDRRAVEVEALTDAASRVGDVADHLDAGARHREGPAPVGKADHVAQSARDLCGDASTVITAERLAQRAFHGGTAVETQPDAAQQAQPRDRQHQQRDYAEGGVECAAGDACQCQHRLQRQPEPGELGREQREGEHEPRQHAVGEGARHEDGDHGDHVEQREQRQQHIHRFRLPGSGIGGRAAGAAHWYHYSRLAEPCEHDGERARPSPRATRCDGGSVRDHSRSCLPSAGAIPRAGRATCCGSVSSAWRSRCCCSPGSARKRCSRCSSRWRCSGLKSSRRATAPAGRTGCVRALGGAMPVVGRCRTHAFARSMPVRCRHRGRARAPVVPTVRCCAPALPSTALLRRLSGPCRRCAAQPHCGEPRVARVARLLLPLSRRCAPPCPRPAPGRRTARWPGARAAQPWLPISDSESHM